MTDGEFGLSDKVDFWNEYIGKYVIIYPANNQATFSGKLKKVVDGYAILNPHQSGVYDKKRGLVRKVIDETSKVDLRNITAIEQTTRKSLDAFCEFLNEQNALELKKRKSKPKDN